MSGASARLLAMLVAAAGVAAVDQWVKLAVATPAWAYHHRSAAWFAGSCALFLVAMLLVLLPSRWVAAGAALLAGGVLGNLLSASADGLDVPNPLLVGRTAGVAFNVADVCILAGNLTLMCALSVVALQRRDRIAAWRSGR